MASIKNINVSGTTYSIIGRVFYGTCSSAATATAKTVTCTDFSAADLVAGAVVIVKNSTANTSTSYSSLTLSVNSTTAKNIKKVQNGTLSNLTAAGEFGASVMVFIYDGSYWVLQANYNTDTNVTQTVTTATTSATYPLILTNNASASSTVTTTVRFDPELYFNTGTNKLVIGGGNKGGALVVGTTTTAGAAGWTTTVPTSTSGAQVGQVCFVIVD